MTEFRDDNAILERFPALVAGVIFADDAGLVFAERWCRRQSDESAARETTTQALITVEANHSAARADVASATCDLLALLKFAGGTYHHATLDADHPTFAMSAAETGSASAQEDRR